MRACRIIVRAALIVALLAAIVLLVLIAEDVYRWGWFNGDNWGFLLGLMFCCALTIVLSLIVAAIAHGIGAHLRDKTGFSPNTGIFRQADNADSGSSRR